MAGDRLTGTVFNDTLVGGSGDDTLVSSLGNDSMDGGGGTNTADYSADPAAVSVDLLNDTATDGWGSQDTLANIQVVLGTPYADTLAGSAAGGETLVGGAGADSISAATATGGDSLDGGSGSNTLVGGAGNDTFDATGSDNVVVGGGGSDVFDDVSYWGAGGSHLTVDSTGNTFVLNALDSTNCDTWTENTNPDTITGFHAGSGRRPDRLGSIALQYGSALRARAATTTGTEQSVPRRSPPAGQ